MLHRLRSTLVHTILLFTGRSRATWRICGPAGITRMGDDTPPIDGITTTTTTTTTDYMSPNCRQTSPAPIIVPVLSLSLLPSEDVSPHTHLHLRLPGSRHGPGPLRLASPLFRFKPSQTLFFSSFPSLLKQSGSRCTQASRGNGAVAPEHQCTVHYYGLTVPSADLE